MEQVTPGTAGQNETELTTKIIDLVANSTKVEKSKITSQTSFVEDLNLDSLDIVELMMKMEDEFGIEIPEDDAEGLKSIQDVVTYLSKKQ